MEQDFPTKDVKEREITRANGGIVLILCLAGLLVSAAVIVLGIVAAVKGREVAGGLLIMAGEIGLIAFSVGFGGLHVINPNEAMVLTLFGHYYGTIRQPGFYYTRAGTDESGAECGGLPGIFIDSV